MLLISKKPIKIRKLIPTHCSDPNGFVSPSEHEKVSEPKVEYSTLTRNSLNIFESNNVVVQQLSGTQTRILKLI